MPELHQYVQPYFFLGIIVIMFLAIYRTWIKPAECFLYAVIILIVTGIISPAEAISGFSNSSIASIFLLILITAGIKNSFNLETYIFRVFDRARGYRRFLFLLMSMVAVVSSFVNNTPVVALMTPYVINWGKHHKISPSRLLIPLSFATIVGGMITIIGTSTTLVLNGFLLEFGLEGLRNVDFLLIGVPVAFISILFITIIAPYVLPNKKDIMESFTSNTREYLIEKRLQDDSPLIGKTVEEGDLRNMKGVYLVEIVRGTKSITPVSRNEVIRPNDVLIFAGNTDTILDISDNNLGIDFPDQVNKINGHMEVVEVVISTNSSLIGRTIRDSRFRNRYDAAVVAVHRNGQRLTGKIGDIMLQAGDVLLLYSGHEFDDRVDLYKDLIVISEERKVMQNPSGTKQLVTLLGIIVVLISTQLFNLFTSLLIIAGAMIAMKMITIRTVKRELDFNMVFILVFSIALGEAMINSGAGTLLAEEVLLFLKPFGVLPVLAGLMLFTIMLTSFISNVGAVAIIFPIAHAIAGSLGIDPMPFFLTIAFAASAAFLTPVGYQTNLMVYGPGGYTFKDFMKAGFPVTLVYSATALLLICIRYNQILFN